MKRWALVIILFTSILMLSATTAMLSLQKPDVPGASRTPVAPQETPSPSPTFCPFPTPELLQVEPLTSPTGLLNQEITVILNNGEEITVVAESGTITSTYTGSNVFSIEVPLLENTLHHLEVSGRVRPWQWNGCVYSGYTLHTDVDVNGEPLIIVQLNERNYLPAAAQSASWQPSSTPAVSELLPASTLGSNSGH